MSLWLSCWANKSGGRDSVFHLGGEFGLAGLGVGGGCARGLGRGLSGVLVGPEGRQVGQAESHRVYPPAALLLPNPPVHLPSRILV